MSRNIIILFDGTSNEVSVDRTNILRLYSVLTKNNSQLVYYNPGVGTFGAESAWSQTYRSALELWGLATGWGLDQNVKNAYRFLVENYDNGKQTGGRSAERDGIYIFGFSRGAYAARVLAGFIHAVGLVRKENLNLVDYAYRAYKRVPDQATDMDDTPANRSASFAEVRPFERILRTDRPPIRCLGLFDTVASVIESGRFGPRFRTHAFTSVNQSVEAIRHAVALDERRTLFQPLLWPSGGEYWGNPFNRARAVPQDVKEVWFRGVHGDVGGGYPEGQSQLAKVPLRWMIEETRPLGLHYHTLSVREIVLGDNSEKQYVRPDFQASRHESMKGAWWLLEYIPRLADHSDPRYRDAWFRLHLPQGKQRYISATTDKFLSPTAELSSVQQMISETAQTKRLD